MKILESEQSKSLHGRPKGRSFFALRSTDGRKADPFLLFALLTVILVFVFTLGASAVALEEKRTKTLEQIDEIKKKVEEIRGLKYQSEFKKGLQSTQALRSYLKEEIDKEYPYKKLYAWKRWLIKFGFINDTVDIKNLLLDLLQEQVVGYYDPERKSLYLIDKDTTDMLGGGAKLSGEEQAAIKLLETMGFDLSAMLLAHELDHALEDQHFDLTKLKRDREKSEDASNALAALIEGESTLLMIEYVIRNLGLDMSVLPDLSELLDGLSTAAGPGTDKLAKAPEYFRELLMFPYVHGAKLSYALRKEGGWDLLNQAFRNPPDSTEQVLHPEKYWQKRDNPIIVALADLKPALGEAWELLEENSLGELNLSILARKFLPAKPSAAQMDPDTVASGWGGDTFQIFENKKTKEALLAWYTTWDSVEAARKFFNGYGTILEKKYPGLVPQTTSAKGPESAKAPAPPVAGMTKGWRVRNKDLEIVIEQRGLDVIVIEGITSPLKDSVVEKLWLSKKKELSAPPLVRTK
jgi:hypothetical protein